MLFFLNDEKHVWSVETLFFPFLIVIGSEVREAHGGRQRRQPMWCPRIWEPELFSVRIISFRYTFLFCALLPSSYTTFHVVLLYVFQSDVISSCFGVRSFDRILLAAIFASGGFRFQNGNGDGATRTESPNLARWDDQCYSGASKHGERVADNAAWKQRVGRSDWTSTP